MVSDEFSDRSQRVLSGVVVSLLGIVLSVVPVCDIWDDVTALRWKDAVESYGGSVESATTNRAGPSSNADSRSPTPTPTLTRRG